MNIRGFVRQGCFAAAVLALSACATNRPQGANQAMANARQAQAAPYGYACYDDFGEPVYYYDAASPGFCGGRQVYVVQQRPAMMPVPSRTLPPASSRMPLPVPDRIGVLGR